MHTERCEQRASGHGFEHSQPTSGVGAVQFHAVAREPAPRHLVPALRMRTLRLVLGAATLVAFAPLAPTQVTNPAHRSVSESQDRTASRPTQDQEPRLLSFERPALVVEGQRGGGLREEDRVGPYQQPLWTTKRRFGETRAYVIPEGQVEFEYWLIPEFPRHGGKVKTKTQYELEFGLPYRFQLDLYAVAEKEGNEGDFGFNEQKFEVRWALADWGRIWGNPTLYAEWAAQDEAPDHVEFKLLLADELAPRWHWGMNGVFEHETGGAQENSYELTGGLSYTVADEKFSIGVESKLAFVNSKPHRGDTATELLLGPSLQYRPVKRAHIDLVPLIGITDDAPQAKVFFLFGWEF